MKKYVIVKNGIPTGFWNNVKDAQEALKHTNGIIEEREVRA